MAKRQTQSDHDSMVESLANHLVNNSHSDVKAHIAGFDTPEKIIWSNTEKGHIPDVTSNSDGQYIFEVETDDSINDSHTEDQWKLFSANAEQHSKKFIVVVPKGSESKVTARAAELGIELDDVWTVG